MRQGEWLVMMGVCTHLGCIPLGDGAGELWRLVLPLPRLALRSSGRIRKGPAPELADPAGINCRRNASGLRSLAGIPHENYEPKAHWVKSGWIQRLPIVGNLNWMWIWGITGIVLVMHYTPHVDMAFASVEHIMRNVNGGWLPLHAP